MNYQFLKNKEKGFIGVAITVIIALIIGGGVMYYYNQNKENVSQESSENTNTSNSETSDWKTYDGGYKNQIQFSYPKDLEINEGDADAFSVIHLQHEGKDPEFSFHMSYNITADESIKNLEEQGFVKKQELLIGGKAATILDGISTHNLVYNKPQKVTKTVVQADEYLYSITYWRSDYSDEVFQNILNSIKFTK